MIYSVGTRQDVYHPVPSHLDRVFFHRKNGAIVVVRTLSTVSYEQAGSSFAFAVFVDVGYVLRCGLGF